MSEREPKVLDPRGKSSRYTRQTSQRFSQNNWDKFDFSETQFIIDEFYTGSPPKIQVSFENLNDNIDEKFLEKEISRLGEIRSVEIVRNPETRQHLGLAKVQFLDPKVAHLCAETYNGKQLMGKQLSVYLDVRFAILERKKDDKLRPQPVVPLVETPKSQPSLPPLPVLTQLPFPSVQIPQPLIDLPRPLNRQHTSLDDRLAKLGLKQSSIIPAVTSQPFSTPDKSSNLQPFHQNNVLNRPEVRTEPQKPTRIPTPPARQALAELEKEWNPTPAKVSIKLSEEVIMKEVLPHCYERFADELKRNLTMTLRRRLQQTYGYPTIEKAQNEFKSQQYKEQLEKENEKKKKLEAKYMSFTGIDFDRQARPQKASINRTINRSRPSIDDLKRVNRTATQFNASTDSHSEDSSDRRSRSPARSGSSSRSSSSSSTTSTSSSSSDSSSQSEHQFLGYSSSPSSSSTSSIIESKSKSKITIDSASQKLIDEATLVHSNSEQEAAEALADLGRTAFQSILDDTGERVPQKPIAKKRRNRDEEQENRVIKKIRSDDTQEGPKQVLHKPRSEKEKERMINDLTTLSEEDITYLKKVHENWQMQNPSADIIRVPFGSDLANKSHVNLPLKNIEMEIASKNHPRWWKGCSRCSMIENSDKGKLEEEEMNYEDLTKAPIKSHVIQAANSTRRDQRSDQRRIAALNPEIDPSFLKQFTYNTLQMRAKNLRFSRSKIHKWGLFACEKIANGDAVIEYVGEKIRPSVADHRELIVYPNHRNHDGSSYFFRVDTDVIDATLKGNKARFINHSCNPNCIAKVIKHENGTNSIVIYAKQTINEDEEITYDYKFPREEGEEKIRCNCKAPNCQKYLN